MGRNIWVNARFTTHPMGGVQRYAYVVSKKLRFVRYVAPNSPKAPYDGLQDSRVCVLPHRLKSHWWEQLVLPTVLSYNDVLWSPAGIGPLQFRNQVLTITDISQIEHPEWYNRTYAFWYKLTIPYLARFVSKIITISNFSKQRIMHVLNVPSEKIAVTYLSVDDIFSPKSPALVKSTCAAYGLNTPYILAVGAISKRKNMHNLFNAWENVTLKHKNISLVVVGKLRLSFSNITSFEQLPPQTIHLESIDDATLSHLYAGATAFVYPSLYEGFGLPVLESMAVGTPVIASRTTSLPEVAGDAAWFIDPYDIASIAAGIERVIDDSNLQEDLRQKGFQRVQQFSWDWTAEQTGNILQEVADSI